MWTRSPVNATIQYDMVFPSVIICCSLLFGELMNGHRNSSMYKMCRSKSLICNLLHVNHLKRLLDFSFNHLEYWTSLGRKFSQTERGEKTPLTPHTWVGQLHSNSINAKTWCISIWRGGVTSTREVVVWKSFTIWATNNREKIIR